jgi:hypothetical protein
VVRSALRARLVAAACLACLAVLAPAAAQESVDGLALCNAALDEANVIAASQDAAAWAAYASDRRADAERARTAGLDPLVGPLEAAAEAADGIAAAGDGSVEGLNGLGEVYGGVQECFVALAGVPAPPPPPGATLPPLDLDLGDIRSGDLVGAPWVIERFDVRILVQPDGELEVTETIEVDFRNLERRGIFRTIPVRYRLEPDDPALPEGADPDGYWREIRIRDVRVESTGPDDLHMEGPGLTGHDQLIRIGEEDTFITGEQRYVISYTVEGAITPGGDRHGLSWNVTGNDWEAPIREASVRVEGTPAASLACFRGPVGSTERCRTEELVDGTADASDGPLRPGEGMTVDVGYARDVLDPPPLLVRPRWTLQRALTGSTLALPLAALAGLVSFGGVGSLLWRQGRDRVATGGTTIDGRPLTGGLPAVGSPGAPDAAPGQPWDGSGGPGPPWTGQPAPAPAARRGLGSVDAPVRFRPPDDLRPAQLGVLVDERVDPVDVSATLVDLAVRGHLRIVEEQSGKLFKKTDWRLQRANHHVADPLLDYERLLLTELFASGPEVTMSELSGTWASSYQKVQKALYADAVARGWFPRSPASTRTRWALLGVLALGLAVGLTWALTWFTTVGIVGVPLVLAALVLLVGSGKMPHRTPEGSRKLAETLGFREFVRTAEAGRMQFAEEQNLFVRYLPYAVVFGATDKWARAFAHLGAAEQAAATGGWYLGSDGRIPSFSSLSSGLSSFSTTAGSSLSTSPSSSGGGSSGGGTGGGGGGSW